MDSASNFLIRIRDEIERFLSENVESQVLTEPISNGEEISLSQSLDKLPWKRYPSGNGAWVFSDTPGASELYQKLMKNDGAVQIGEWWYRLKKEDRFIGRFPIRKRRIEE
jgi:hypothetical protein